VGREDEAAQGANKRIDINDRAIKIGPLNRLWVPCVWPSSNFRGAGAVRAYSHGGKRHFLIARQAPRGLAGGGLRLYSSICSLTG
jgi:hypothetical protein